MAGYAVEYGAVGNEGENVNVGRARGQGRGDSSGELVGGAEGEGVVAARALGYDQKIGRAINRVGRGIKRGVGCDLKLGHLINGQIPRDRSACDGKAGGVEVVGGGVFLRRVDHGHTGSDRCRTGADCKITGKRGG